MSKRWQLSSYGSNSGSSSSVSWWQLTVFVVDDSSMWVSYSIYSYILNSFVLSISLLFFFFFIVRLYIHAHNQLIYSVCCCRFSFDSNFNKRSHLLPFSRIHFSYIFHILFCFVYFLFIHQFIHNNEIIIPTQCYLSSSYTFSQIVWIVCILFWYATQCVCVFEYEFKSASQLVAHLLTHSFGRIVCVFLWCISFLFVPSMAPMLCV